MKVYDIITERILAALDKGIIPWRKPWRTKGASGVGPTNLVSKKAYRGINVFLLASAGFDSPYWLTYNQAKKLGGNVRKGEKSTPVIFWQFKEREDENGKKRNIPILRYYSVFNVRQCEGLESKIPATINDEPRDTVETIAICESVVKNLENPPTIIEECGSDRCCYSPLNDTIYMDNRQYFESAEAYYATLFHELGHASGHDSRLARDLGGRFGGKAYAREELIAEFSAAFVCGTVGIDTPTLQENTVAYIASWKRKLTDDPQCAIVAAGAAQKAADWILGTSWGESETEEVIEEAMA